MSRRGTHGQVKGEIIADLKIAGRVVLACFFFSVFLMLPGAVNAATPPADAPGKEIGESGNPGGPIPGSRQTQTAVGLEQAIRIAKERFPAPEGFDQFSTGFAQSGENSFWELRWYRNGEPGGQLNVSVNAETGEIWSMSRWVPLSPGQSYRGLPRYTREQAEAIAGAFAREMQPERFRQTSLQPGRDYVPLPAIKDRGQVEYSYNYARLIDGVLYPENGITVTVNGDTGEILQFHLRWDDTRGFPPAAGRISQERAEQIFCEEAAPELCYFLPSARRYENVPVRLVYRLPGQRSRVVIDALTGKLLSSEGGYLLQYDEFSGGAGAMRKMMSDTVRAPQEIKLSPDEELAVEEAGNLLSRDEALEAAKKAVTVPQGFTLKSSRLERDYQFKDKKTWYFNWQAGDGQNGGGLDVSVDAASGELVSFYRYSGESEYLKTPEVKFSEENARAIAEAFVKKVQPGKWGQVAFGFSRTEPGPVLDQTGETPPRSYSFNWDRVVKGVRFPQNGFELTVSSTTGEITGYRLNWWELDFPDPRGVISREAAAAGYLQKAPLKAAYLRLWSGFRKPPGEGGIRLVYYTGRQDFAGLDAFTGQPLDYAGNVITEYALEKFSDMEGHPAREAVELLAATGIVAGVDGKFRPDDPVTQAELITMLVKSSGQFTETVPPAGAGGREPWYRAYYEAAARIGILQPGEKPDPDAAVTRETLARLTVRAMGYQRVAQLSDIYVLNFQDADEIPAYLKGHVALSVALGLIEPVEERFEPGAAVTRAEAATTLVRMLKNGR
ncbi:MAG TPA: S-layer homology domain-containing protein [Bacillota bacterium]|nr:S-layer homology domain-containing protein [Bacillota bacterium]